MSNHCVVTRSPQFKRLFNEVFYNTEFVEPYVSNLAADVSLWQEKNNSLDTLPNVNQIDTVAPIPLKNNEELYKKYNLLAEDGNIKTVLDNKTTTDWVKTLNFSPNFSFKLSKTPKGNKILIYKKREIKDDNGQLSFFQKDNAINYQLKAIQILTTPKADEIFRKGDKNNWDIDKILTELLIPKEQQELIKSFNTRNREEILTSLLANYSYTIEINIAKEISKYSKTNTTEGQFFYDGATYEDRMWDGYFKNNIEISQQEFQKVSKEYHSKRATETQPTQHYSNLTVPGGTNYTENEIATPAITPSIKGHAQFSTDNGLMWSRTDEKVQYQEQDIDNLLKIMENSKVLQIKCS